MNSPAAAAPYKPTHHVRIVTAASLFDGHDAAINVMRRIMQASGAEVIHLGHNRAVAEIDKNFSRGAVQRGDKVTTKVKA